MEKDKYTYLIASHLGSIFFILVSVTYSLIVN